MFKSKTVTVEVCIDNIESLHTAIKANANRIELCSALALGGLTPSLGLIKKALALSTIPIYIMIRPRAGDFVFNEEEISLMEEEIAYYRNLGAAGVVIGALNTNATINENALSRWVNAAGKMGVTFHRAFDLVTEPKDALDILIKYNIDRVLTSGQQSTALHGIKLIKEMVDYSSGRVSIMAGSGVNIENAKELIESGIHEIHLSGKTLRPSKMKKNDSNVSMGSDSTEDYVNVTSYQKIHDITKILREA
ncbi:copper homeostasis protein CutC [Vibrio sp.]|nr:copper homeostasis protein CutC [Vibrio sp.]